MPTVGNLEVEVAPFDKRIHDRTAFDCGESSLTGYVKSQMSQDLKNSVAVPFVLTESGSDRIIGYYTLSSYSIELGDLPESVQKKLPKYPKVPCTMLGRLAVDQQFKGKRLGEFLLLDALSLCLAQSEKIASYAVIVEAINDEAVGFYKRFDFEQFADMPSRFYLPMKDIAQIFEVKQG